MGLRAGVLAAGMCICLLVCFAALRSGVAHLGGHLGKLRVVLHGSAEPVDRNPQSLAMTEKETVKAVVGVFSGMSDVYITRRRFLRSAWMPSTEEAIMHLQRTRGVIMRFAMGYSEREEEMKALEEEEQAYGRMIRLPVKEKYHNLVLKVRRFIQWALELYNFDFMLKVDDDVYFNPHRMSMVAAEWLARKADYVGCFHYDVPPQSTSTKGFETNAAILPPHYHPYALGPTYALSYEAANRINHIPDGWLRYFGCGDGCSVASWMMLVNATYQSDTRLCFTKCADNSVSVWNVRPLRLPILHDDPICSGVNTPGFERQDKRFSAANCYQLATSNDTAFVRCVPDSHDGEP